MAIAHPGGHAFAAQRRRPGQILTMSSELPCGSDRDELSSRGILYGSGSGSGAISGSGCTCQR